MVVIRKPSSSAKVDIIAERFYERIGYELEEGEIERLYWLYDNDVEFEYYINRNYDRVEINILEDEGKMGYKLRWL